MKTIQTFIFTLGCSALLLSSCGGKKEDKAAQAGADQPQSYPVVTLTSQSTTLESDYPATLEGQQNIDIRPKIDGFIEKIFVDEGATVKQGQPLFSINAPQYEQEVRTAKAAVNSAEAEVNAAKLQYNKTKPLVEKDIISKFDLESAEYNLKIKQAALAQARAALANANVNLGYTRVVAPVNGVIGRIPYKTGALVSSQSAEPLTTISNIAKVYAYFSLNEKQILDFSRDYKGATLTDKIRQIPSVSLILSDGTVYAQNGRIETVSGQIDTQTGSASMRATFPNPSILLRSGASALVRIPKHLDAAILIPQKSTSDIQGKKFAYQVDQTGAVKAVEIEIMANTKGNFYVVTKGLKAGDKIVLEGFSGLKDGTKIKAEERPADSVFAELKN
ncbi:efflux RND transporter periplasmic adaptor subunit [Pedobacter yulinensis]|uniref:Efflux RND transporter periplasmic adaptor subunit n=1 Tax=Pedobacter yulinensis TaxID=2126353 RepID=A0A2T3HR83_9SPHI|nr:efflux RND transporter periplasmic adaptor subunit [Pedobacter yulinensis]PST84939.1 efflux RND transporter periplasmic adaptor subunit [Pedobacter yulinensis]